jgi:hypothetical protein
MATGGTSSDPWTNLTPAHAARLLEHIRTWQRRLRDAVDRHYDPSAYDVARELHDVVDRVSADLVRVFGDVGLRAPVESWDRPRPRRGPLGMNVLHAPDNVQGAVATGDPDLAVSALTSWSTWLEERAAVTPASVRAAATLGRPGDDARLDEWRPAAYFRTTRIDPSRLRHAIRECGWKVKKQGRTNWYRIGDVAERFGLTREQLDKLDEKYNERMLRG